jgi:hypothetical protein
MMDLLQWSGFACIVGGYWLFARSKWWGAAVSIVGAVPLALWAFIVDAHGVFALQIACAAMNARTLYQERSKCPNEQSTLLDP